MLNGSLYILFSRFGLGEGFYYRAYYGTILSYMIIIYKAHGVPQISRAYMQRILMYVAFDVIDVMTFTYTRMQTHMHTHT